MKKRIVSLLFAVMLVLSLGSCGTQESQTDPGFFEGFREVIDVEFAKAVIEKISSLGDDPVMGMRSAGSPAETETANYIEGVMKEIGLENVTMEEFISDGWTFKGANISFTNADGKDQRIDLGAYQTTIVAENEEYELVYANEGTEADYEELDVEGKLVLIDVDQDENWWINYPAYQAKAKGAKAVIAMSVYPEDGPGRVGVQDICGPADAPALAISQQDSLALIEAIEASGGDSIKVILNADSRVTSGAVSHNVWGEIPGETPETIFVFAHMDGYFHSAYDDAQGVATSLAIAKALIDSEYMPEKTIRFCFHGAEEWGVSGSEYDWSTGAYKELAVNHPEWVEGAFAIVNNDGGYAVDGEIYMGTGSVVELIPFIEESLGELNEESKYEWSYYKSSTYTEDFYWTRMGVPAITADSGDGEIYYSTGYHSTYDSWIAQPLDEEGLAECIAVYGKLVLDLDSSLVRPMSFTARIEDFEESLADPDEFEELISEAYEAATAIEARMEAVEEGGDKDEALELNKQLQEIYIALQDALLGLDFDIEVIVKHELYQNNVEALDGAIAALEEGDVIEAFDEYISAVDWAWYDMNFDEETCRYFEEQLFNNRDDTWGAGLVLYPHCDIGGVVRSLAEKYEDEDADVTAEIKELKRLREEEQRRLEQTLADERAGLEKAIGLMQRYVE